MVIQNQSAPEEDDLPETVFLADRQRLLMPPDVSTLVLAPFVPRNHGFYESALRELMESSLSRVLDCFWLPFVNEGQRSTWGIYVGNRCLGQVDLSREGHAQQVLDTHFLAADSFPTGYVTIVRDDPDITDQVFDGTSTWAYYETPVPIDGSPHLTFLEIWVPSSLGFGPMEIAEMPFTPDELITHHNRLAGFNSVIKDRFIENRPQVESTLRELSELVRPLTEIAEYCTNLDIMERPPGHWDQLHESLWKLVSEMEGLSLSDSLQSIEPIRGRYEAVLAQLDHL